MHYFTKFKCVVLLFASWVILSAIIFCWAFGLLDTGYVKFGPSNDLIIIGIGVKIETWGKWWFICSFSFVDSFFSYFLFDKLFPWINSSILNTEKLGTHNSKGEMWVLINTLYVINALRMIFTSGLVLTQIDIFLIGQLGSLLAGSLTSGYAILSKPPTLIPVKIVETELQELGNEINDNSNNDKDILPA